MDATDDGKSWTVVAMDRNHESAHRVDYFVGGERE